jgi:rod shape determining protein RodA
MRRLFGHRAERAGDKLWRVPWLVLALAGALAAIGTSTLYSVAGGAMQPWAETHALRFMMGAAAVLAMAVVPLNVWGRLAYPVYGVALLLLAMVPFLGTEVMGARRWLGIGGLSVQPAELMKVGLVLALARFYQWLPEGEVSRPQWVGAGLLLIAAPVLLTLRQPDLGTAVLLAALGLILMFLAGTSFLYYAGAALGVWLIAPSVWTGLHEYQKRRIEVFLDPELDPLGAGYHITQSKIALGAGGAGGKGFMLGTQSQLDFLPEKHTDFIFTMFSEEWGFAGAVVLLAIYGTLLALLMVMSLQVRSPFGRLLVSGAALMIFLYLFINVAMVTGLVPVVGVPLPFVSYGGTAMTALVAALGLAMSAHVHRNEPMARGRLGGLI